MQGRKALLLGLLATSVVGATLLWSLQNSLGPSDRTQAEGATEVDTPPARNAGKQREALSGDREQKLAQQDEPFEEAIPEPQKQLAESWRSKMNPRREFDSGALESSGFSAGDIDWFRERWEQAQRDRNYLAELDARGEDAPRGGGYSDVERELREDLRDSGYDAMLYATNQSNRVALVGVRNGSVASRAGIRDGSVVWSYDGQRVFHPDELATLSATGTPGEPVEILIVTRAGTESIFVERNPLGAELVAVRARPDPGS